MSPAVFSNQYDIQEESVLFFLKGFNVLVTGIEGVLS